MRQEDHASQFSQETRRQEKQVISRRGEKRKSESYRTMKMGAGWEKSAQNAAARVTGISCSRGEVGHFAKPINDRKEEGMEH